MTSVQKHVKTSEFCALVSHASCSCVYTCLASCLSSHYYYYLFIYISITHKCWIRAKHSLKIHRYACFHILSLNSIIFLPWELSTGVKKKKIIIIIIALCDTSWICARGGAINKNLIFIAPYSLYFTGIL